MADVVSLSSKYKDACNHIQVGPISRMIRELHTTEINLVHHGLGLKDTQALAEVLPLSTITKLTLKDNCLSGECVTTISHAITGLPTLTFLDLSKNKMCTKGAASIAAMIKDTASLRTLNLAHNKMGDNTAMFIIDSLKGSSLRSLNISGNNLSDESGSSLANLIRENPTIELLDVSFNALANRGAVAFLSALQGNECLKTLDVSWNGLSNDGAEALSKALRNNTALSELNIASNRISDDGMKHVADMLTENKKLTKLQVFLNPFGCVGFAFLLEALLKSPDSPLKELKMTDLNLDDRVEVLLSRTINARPKLKLQFLRQKIQFNLGNKEPGQPEFPLNPAGETPAPNQQETPGDEPQPQIGPPVSLPEDQTST